jgi:N,N-dimethylformamidase beta subunit-like protein
MTRMGLRAGGIFVFLLLLTASASAARRQAVRHPAPPFNAAWTEGGYADRTSVAQGGQITFSIATSVSPFKLSIVNLADASVVVHEVPNLTSRAQNCTGRFTSGCGWLATHTMNIPVSWPSGYYAAIFPSALGERRLIFVVRENAPGNASRILVVSPTNTYQAYNEFGGGSLYPSNDPKRASRLSFDRPYEQDGGIGRYDNWERKFADWMRREHRTFEVATDSDLEDPTLLGHYRLVLLIGHSEYWTSAARQNLETFSRNGGHVAIFAGNTMWWQVRIEDNGRTLVSYKDAAGDPIRETDQHLVTTHFWSEPVNDPENALVGSSTRFGGYSNRVDDPASYEMLPLAERTGYLVTEASHWIFQGANVAQGTAFGREIAGLEVDGAIFNCAAVTGLPAPDGADGTPLNYHILAVTPASDGYGTIGIYTNPMGGAVFNAGTQNWVDGLASDPIVQTATRNVLDRLGTGQRQVYDAVTSPILTQELFNCPQTSKLLLPGWQSNHTRGRVTSECAYEGPAGLQLSGGETIALTRDFTSLGEIRNHLELRFYAKLDALAGRELPAPFITLRNRSGSRIDEVAAAEFYVVQGTKMVRVSRRDPGGGFFASDWISLAAGWHLLELTWRSPGTIALQVDGGKTVSLNNPDANQIASEVLIAYPSAQAQEGEHACIDAIAVATEKLGAVAAVR